MTLDEILNERMTDDEGTKKIEDNYRGLLESPNPQRNYAHEQIIKLNRYERLMTPTNVEDIKDWNSVYRCPHCHCILVIDAKYPKHCDECAQALDWSEVEYGHFDMQ